MKETITITLCCPPRTKCPQASLSEDGKITIKDEEQSLPGEITLTPEQIAMLFDFSKKVFEG